MAGDPQALGRRSVPGDDPVLDELLELRDWTGLLVELTRHGGIRRWEGLEGFHTNDIICALLPLEGVPVLPCAEPLDEVDRVDHRLQADKIIRSAFPLDINDAYLDEELHVILG